MTQEMSLSQVLWSYYFIVTISWHESTCQPRGMLSLVHFLSVVFHSQTRPLQYAFLRMHSCTVIPDVATVTFDSKRVQMETSCFVEGVMVASVNLDLKLKQASH
eukprot:1489154-Amphidinium_carterae.1